MNIKKTPLSRGILSALATVSVSAFAVNEPSPFASSPLYLQNSVTETARDGVKPNVLIQFDDSTSMNERIEGNNYTYKKKIIVAKDALLKLLSNPKYKDSMYWSFITLNWQDQAGFKRLATNPNTYPLNMGADKVKRIVSSLPNNIPKNKLTPSTYRYLDSAYLIRRHLNSPNPSDIPKTKAQLFAKSDPNAYKYRCQKNYIIIFSDGAANDPDISYADANGVVRQTAKRIKQGGRTYATLPQERPNFMDQRDWGYYATYPQAPFANTYNYELSQPQPSIDAIHYLAKYLNDHDLKQGGVDAAGKSWDDPEFKKQNIETFTVGFGNGLSGNGRVYLNAAATGNHYRALNASNEQELDDAFATIFNKITGDNKIDAIEAYSTVSPGPTGGITTGIPSMAAVVGLDTGSWSSEIRFFGLDLSADDDQSTKAKVDTSNYVQPEFDQRKLMVSTQNGIYMSTDRNSGISNDTFAINTSHNKNEWFNSMLPWLARSKSIGQINVPGNALIYRDRKITKTFNTRNMGDVLESNVLAIGKDVNGRQEFMVTAANDGLVYIFKSNPDKNKPYSLVLNYAPITMQRQNSTDYLAHYFKDIVNEKYGKDLSHPHQYMINGGITVRRTDDAKGKGRQIFMVGNMGQGGRGAYALNIGGENREKNTPTGINASESNWTKTVPLFETPKGADNKLGYTIGTPQIGRFAKVRDTSTGRPDPKNNAVQYGAFISNGFNSPETKESALYVYEALGQDVGLNGSRPVDDKGTLIAKIIADKNTGGLATPTLVDLDFDGIIDLAYAGDKAGNMYRFDFRGPSPSFWTATRIFEGTASKPITAAPAIFRCNEDDKCSNSKDDTDPNHYQFVVIFGTGSDMYQSDLTDNSTQSVYGIFDDLSRTTAVRQNQLQVQTIEQTKRTNKQGVERGVRILSDDPITANNYYGWYFDLPDVGERVVTKPEMILRTAIFATRSYSTSHKTTDQQSDKPYDPCIAEKETFSTQGHSWLMAVDVKNGGSINSANYEGEAYVDFFAEGKHHKKIHSQLQQGEQQDVPGVIYSGYDMGAGLTAFSTISTTKKGLAITENGDSGQSGDDLSIKETPGTPPDNLCFDDNGYILPVTSSGIQEPYFYNGKICSPPPGQGSLRRISVREIAL